MGDREYRYVALTMREISLSREEAELLTDLLLGSEHHCAAPLGQAIRDKFGMVSEKREIETRDMINDAYHVDNGL